MADIGIGNLELGICCRLLVRFTLRHLNESFLTCVMNFPIEVKKSKVAGKGAFAQLQLFTQEEINLLKAKDLLINEANLIFYVDQEKMANVTVEPNRLFVYDIRNHLTLDDYALDRTVSANTKFNKSIFDGKLQKNSSNKGIKYRVRITKHIQNIVNKDSTNVNLGLTLTENINLVSL